MMTRGIQGHDDVGHLVVGTILGSSVEVDLGGDLKALADLTLVADEGLTDDEGQDLGDDDADRWT